MKVVAENRHEIWVSFGVTILGFMFSAVAPLSYGDVLIITGSLLIGLCCAINAVLDIEDMGIPGKFLSVIWLAILLVANPWWLIFAFSIRDFSNK